VSWPDGVGPAWVMTVVWTGEGKFQLRFGACDTGGVATAAAPLVAATITGWNPSRLPPPPPLLDRWPPLPPNEASV
jgi:hypothetical protein